MEYIILTTLGVTFNVVVWSTGCVSVVQKEIANDLRLGDWFGKKACYKGQKPFDAFRYENLINSPEAMIEENMGYRSLVFNQVTDKIWLWNETTLRLAFEGILNNLSSS